MFLLKPTLQNVCHEIIKLSKNIFAPKKAPAIISYILTCILTTYVHSQTQKKVQIENFPQFPNVVCSLWIFIWCFILPSDNILKVAFCLPLHFRCVVFAGTSFFIWYEFSNWLWFFVALWFVFLIFIVKLSCCCCCCCYCYCCCLCLHMIDVPWEIVKMKKIQKYSNNETYWTQVRAIQKVYKSKYHIVVCSSTDSWRTQCSIIMKCR